MTTRTPETIDRTIRCWATAALLVLAGTAQAALINRGGGMIYDTTRNLTWLSDMNYAFTSGYATKNVGGTGPNQILDNGRMGWDAANTWVNDLEFGGYDDWRLPTLDPSDPNCSGSIDPGGGFPVQRVGYNCTGGELGGLFITDLGNKAGESVLDQAGDTQQQRDNLALFKNVRSNVYWSGTEYAPRPSSAWAFYAGSGDADGALDKGNQMYALAVRSGDVAAAVPEPQTLALALLALGATALARRRASR